MTAKGAQVKAEGEQVKAKGVQVFLRPTCTVITVPDPDNVPAASLCEVGGMIQFRSDAPNYPHFVIEFDTENPEDNQDRRTLPGNRESPVVMRSNKEGCFSYTVTYLTDAAHQLRVERSAPASQAKHKSSDSDGAADPVPPPPPSPTLGPFYVDSVPC